MRILLAEDDELLGNAIQQDLKQVGYTTDWIKDGHIANAVIQQEEFDVIILDLNLPKKNGQSVLKNARSNKITTPVLVLTANNELETRIQCLDAGADDFISKPFELEELCARLRALSRRAGGRSSPKLEYQDILLDPASHEASKSGELINLSRKEFAILEALLNNQGRVISRNKMLDILYGWDDQVDSNTLEVHIHHLRKKLGNNLIRTVRGVGYIMPKSADTVS